MKQSIVIFLIATLLFIGKTDAHDDIELKLSSPSNKEMLMKSPDNLVLEFVKDVRLVKLTLSSEQGETIKFGFKPSKNIKAKYEWTLPKLKPATYKLHWSILGNDGHLMKNSLGFMVH